MEIRVVVCSFLAAMVAACGSDDTAPAPAPAVCPYSVAGQCVGVPTAPLCSADPCTEGATCTQTISVAAPGDLAAALAGAAPGACVALSPGAYGGATLPPGVSLLGRDAALVSIDALTVEAGGDALVRGVTIGAGGAVVTGPGAIGFDAVRFQSSSGVVVSDQAALAISRSEVLAAQDIAVSMGEGTSLAMSDSVIADGEGPGIAARCETGCMCATKPNVSLERVLVRNQAHVGVFFEATDANLSTVVIEDTRVRDLDENSGGGLVASACTTIDAKGTTISGNAYFGALIDSSSGKLGSPGEANSIIIHTNVLGLWVQGADASLEVDNAKLSDNQGVGIGTSGASVSIIIHTSEVKSTIAKSLVVAGGGSEEVGDGFVWTDGAKAVVDGLAISASGRQAVLIDGDVAAGSSLANVSLAGGDESDGIVQQNLAAGGTSPTIGASAPMLSSSPDAVFSVPAPPGTPD